MLSVCVCAWRGPVPGGGSSANPVKQIMTDLSERLPPDFIMIIIMEKVRAWQGYKQQLSFTRAADVSLI